MADDVVTINPATVPGGHQMRTARTGTVHTPVSVIEVDGALVAAANPLPVTGAFSVAGVATEAGQGTDGSSPPSVAGTGVRGWLRAIYERLLATLSADVTDRAGRILGHVAVDASALPAGAATDAGLAAVYARQADGSQHALIDNFPATQAVSAAALPLPSGAATEATLAARAAEHVTAASPHAARLTDGSAFYRATTPADTQPMSAAVLPLPSGASTEATLAAIKTKTDNLDVALSTRAVTGLTDAQLRAAAVPVGDGGGSLTVDGSVAVSNFPATQPVSVASLPLPAGAATEATNAKRFAGGKTSGATVISTTGDNTIKTPASGTTLTLYWIFLSSSQNNSAEVLATVKLGSKVVYECYLGNPGAWGHWEPVVADNPNDALVVNLSAGSQSVAVNYTTTEA